jgi:hypothetical protein
MKPYSITSKHKLKKKIIYHNHHWFLIQYHSHSRILAIKMSCNKRMTFRLNKEEKYSQNKFNSSVK